MAEKVFIKNAVLFLPDNGKPGMLLQGADACQSLFRCFAVSLLPALWLDHAEGRRHCVASAQWLQLRSGNCGPRPGGVPVVQLVMSVDFTDRGEGLPLSWLDAFGALRRPLKEDMLSDSESTLASSVLGDGRAARLVRKERELRRAVKRLGGPEAIAAKPEPFILRGVVPYRSRWLLWVAKRRVNFS